MKKKNGEPYCPLCWLFNSGILTMSYYSPYITEKYNPLDTRNNGLIGKVVGKPLGGGPLAV